MEVSSPASEPLPEGVTEDELYEGPNVIAHPAALVRPVPVQQPMTKPPPEADIPPPTDRGVSFTTSPPQERSRYPDVIMLALDVLAARLLGLIALVTACLIWAGVVWDPLMWRIIAAGAFSLTVFLPMMAIYWKSGMTGEGG